MPTITDQERASGKFDMYKPTEADYAKYMGYSVARLRLLAWLGDTVAQKIIKRLRVS